MSEGLLNAIMKLFALVAKEDGITDKERKTVENYVLNKLNAEALPHYMGLFDQFVQSYTQQSASGDEMELVKSIATGINTELTIQQKYILVYELIELILADGEIAEQEIVIVENICKEFKVATRIIAEIIAFVEAKSEKDINGEDFLLISDKLANKKTKHISIGDFDGFISVMRIPEVDMYLCKYHGQELIYLNGLPFKSSQVQIFSPGSTIKPQKARPVYYSDVVSTFLRDEKQEKIVFIAENISFSFPGGKLGLRDINLQEESGSLIGLMGASGAGKSTLLNVLNGNESPSKGRVLINGLDLHQQKDELEGIIGYVPQDDLLMEELTVFQNLYFAAKLCFNSYDEEKLKTLVNKTLQSLGLVETADLKVGSPLEKTISGGQRKRLNIGLELLREPAVLFVDEPTSGLSSRDSENIMDLLKELSLKGKLIFVVIHQPSSDIFKMFDRLVILDVGGYQIYYGNPVEAVLYFRDKINMVNLDAGACIECGNVNPEQIFNIIETKIINEYGRFTDQRKITPKQWNNFFLERYREREVISSKDQVHGNLDVPGKIKQFSVFFMRDFLSKLSNKQYLLINLLEAPLLAFLLAFIVRYYPINAEGEGAYWFSKNLNIPAYFFMSIIVALFMGLTMSAEEIIRDRKILKREKFLNLSRSSYLLSKIAILFGFAAIQTFLYVLIGDTILEIDNMSLSYWSILFSTSCFAVLLGLNVSDTFNSAVTIYILIPLLLIPQLILSGVVVKFDELNPQISSKSKVPMVGEMMASRWAFEAAIVTQFMENEYESQLYPFDMVMAEADYKKLYLLPALQGKLEFVNQNMGTQIPEIRQKIEQDLSMLRTYLHQELEIVGKSQFGKLEELRPESFQAELYRESLEFIAALNRFYSLRYNKASDARDAYIAAATNTPEKKEAFDKLRKENQNEYIVTLVKNTADATRIKEYDGKLIQKVYPIYMSPQPDHLLDFRGPLYLPEKHFLGYYFPTRNFNVAIICCMSIFLFFTLYFSLFRKLVEGLSSWKIVRK